MNDAAPQSTASHRLARNRRVDAVCSRFEADWRAAAARGTRPRLDDYLGKVPEPGLTQPPGARSPGAWPGFVICHLSCANDK